MKVFTEFVGLPGIHETRLFHSGSRCLYLPMVQNEGAAIAAPRFLAWVNYNPVY